MIKESICQLFNDLYHFLLTQNMQSKQIYVSCNGAHILQEFTVYLFLAKKVQINHKMTLLINLLEHNNVYSLNKRLIPNFLLAQIDKTYLLGILPIRTLCAFAVDVVYINKQNQLMKTRSNSAPRMQQTFTPRVKDGRLSNDSPQKNYYNKTAPRFHNANPNYNYNPESSPLLVKGQTKMVEHRVQQIVQQKVRLQVPAQQGVSQNVAQIKNTKVAQNRPGKTQKVEKINKQQTIQGRKLEYPVERFAGAYNNIRQNQSIELHRSSSLQSSQHYVDRGIKSASIKARKSEFNDKFKVAFGYLLDQNQAYLKECRRACNQKARPKDQIFTIKRPTITTTNKDQYHQKDTPYAQHMDPRAQTVANSFGPRKVCGNSTSNEFHAGRQGPRADLAQWPEGFKLQGPIYQATTYGNHFPHPGDYQKMVPIAKFNEHPLGMPHRTNSTSRTFHKGQFTKRADLATWNNMHPYGNEFNPERGTTYGTKHNFKEQQPIQQWPMYDPSLLKSDGKFTTEYGSQLVNPTAHQLNHQNYCDCGRKQKVH